VQERTPGGLWRDRSFHLLFAGYVISWAGSAITLVVLPILVFQLTGSALQTSVLLTIQAVPYLAFGLVAGAVADRVNRRVLMVGGDVLNAAVLASIPVASGLGVLTVAHVYVAALLSATVFVWSDAADLGALPAIVGKRRVVAATSVVYSTSKIVSVAAPSIGGVLAATFGAAQTISLGAASYLLPALAVARIPRAFGTPAPQEGGRRQLIRGVARDIGEGLRFVRDHQLIRPLTLLGFGNSLTGGAVLGLLVVYGVRQLGLADDDPRLGWLFSAGSVGALIAGLMLPRLTRRLNPARISLLGYTANFLALGGVALTTSLPLSLLLLVVWQGTYVLVISNGIVLRQQLTPDRLQSRVNVTARMIAWGGQPFGAAIGGAIAELASMRAAYLLMALGVGLSAALGWLSALRRVDAATVTRLLDEADRLDERSSDDVHRDEGRGRPAGDTPAGRRFPHATTDG